jgi:hypothetical protein
MIDFDSRTRDGINRFRKSLERVMNDERKFKRLHQLTTRGNSYYRLAGCPLGKTIKGRKKWINREIKRTLANA